MSALVDKISISVSPSSISGGSGISMRFSFNAFNLLCILISIGFGTLSVYLQHLFYQCQVHVTTNQQLDFARQKWKCFLNTSSSGFCLGNIFLAIGSNFCLKLALLSLSRITYKFMSSCIPLANSLVTKRYFWTSSDGFYASLAILQEKFSLTELSIFWAKFL